MLNSIKRNALVRKIVGKTQKVASEIIAYHDEVERIKKELTKDEVLEFMLANDVDKVSVAKELLAREKAKTK